MNFDVTSMLLPCVVVAAVMVVVGSELIKKLDKKNRMKGYRVYIPMVLSVVAALLLVVGEFITFRQVPFYGAVIFGLSVFEYEGILRKFTASKKSKAVRDAENSEDGKNEKPI